MKRNKIETWAENLSCANLWSGQYDVASVAHLQPASDPGLNCREFAIKGRRDSELAITNRFVEAMGSQNVGAIVSQANQQKAAGLAIEVFAFESGIAPQNAGRMDPNNKPSAGWYLASGGWVNADHTPSCDAWDHAWLEYWNADGSRVIFESFTRQILNNTQTREQQQLSVWAVPAGTPNRLHHSKTANEQSTIAVATRVSYKPLQGTIDLIYEGLSNANEL